MQTALPGVPAGQSAFVGSFLSRHGLGRDQHHIGLGDGDGQRLRFGVIRLATVTVSACASASSAALKKTV